MTITPESLKESIRTFSLIKCCDVVRNGMLRIATPFTYPNGSHVDLFLTPSADAVERLEMTDLGVTLDYLSEMSIRPQSTAKRKQVLSDICKSLDVEFHNGALRVIFPASDVGRISEIMIRLGQACIRVGEMQWSQRFRTATVFQDDFEEALEGMQLRYEANPELLGRHGSHVTFNYLVYGAHLRSAVRTLSTGNQVAAHTMTNEALRSFVALEGTTDKPQCVTVFDTTQDVFRSDDLRLLEDYSLVLGFPSQSDAIRQALAA